MELTTLLPCTTLRPASMISHLELSIITGTRAISGSAPIRFKNLTMAAFPSIIPSSILTSIILGPPLLLVPRLLRPLTHNLLPQSTSKIFWNPFTLVRSPILTKLGSGETHQQRLLDQKALSSGWSLCMSLEFGAFWALPWWRLIEQSVECVLE